jgi:hypothetical protein
MGRNFRKLAGRLAVAVIAMAAPSATRAGPMQGENLQFAAPKGFQVAKHDQQGQTEITEYLPEGEAESAPSRSITVQILHNMNGLEPDLIADEMKSQLLPTCAGSEARKLQGGQDNGYSYSIWLFTCPQDSRTGKPKNAFIKIIRGGEALYFVTFQYNSMLSEDATPATLAFFAGARLCDTRRPDRPCAP